MYIGATKENLEKVRELLNDDFYGLKSDYNKLLNFCGENNYIISHRLYLLAALLEGEQI